MRGLLKEIYKDIPSSNPSLMLVWKYRLINPSYRVLHVYRIGRYFSKSQYRILRIYSSILKSRLIFKLNSDISYDAHIGKNFKLAHPVSLVIGAGVIIEDNVTIFQNVTLGSHGSPKEIKKKYPIIKSNAVIYAGAVILGGITIGENSIVGANTIVKKDVPKNHIAYGNPCQIKPLLHI